MSDDELSLHFSDVEDLDDEKKMENEEEELFIYSDNEQEQEDDLDLVKEDELVSEDDDLEDYLKPEPIHSGSRSQRPCGPRPTKNNNAYTLNELRTLAIKQGHSPNDVMKLKISELCELLKLAYTNSKMIFDDFPSCLKLKKSDVVEQHKDTLNAKGITTKAAMKIKKDVLCDLIYKDKSPFQPPEDFKESDCHNYNFPTLKRIAVNVKVDTARAKTHEDYCRLIALHYLRKNMTFSAVRNPYWNDVMGEEKCMAPLSKNLELQKHQKAVVRHLLKHRGLITVHATGTGKTLTAATAINCMLAKYPNIRIVVITPLSLVDNFFSNLVRFGIDINDPEFVARVDIKSYEEYVNEQRRKSQVDCRNTFLIVDEAHNLRTDFNIATTDLRSNSRAYTIMLCASQAFKVMLLTATPIVNSVFDLRNLIMMVHGTHPNDAMSKTAFQKHAAVQLDEWLRCKVSYYEAPQEFYPERIDVPLEESTIYMTPEYLTKYREIEKRQSSVLHSGYLKDSSLVQKFYHGMRVAINALDGEESPKINWIMDFLQKEIAAGRKTIVFSNWKKAGMNILRKRLDALNMKNLYAYVTGDVPKEVRELIKLKYNANKIKVLLITRAGGEGLDLHETRNIIIMESNWNPSIDYQIIGRGIRYKSHIKLPKEDQNVKIIRLMLQKPQGWEKTFDSERESVDQLLYDLAYLEKAPMMQQVVDIMKDMSIENQICDCNDDEKSYIEGCQTIEITPKRKVQKEKKKVETSSVPVILEFGKGGKATVLNPEAEVIEPKNKPSVLQFDEELEELRDESGDELQLVDDEPIISVEKKEVKKKQYKRPPQFEFVGADVKSVSPPRDESEVPVLQLEDEELELVEDEEESKKEVLGDLGVKNVIYYEKEEEGKVPILELSDSEEEEEEKKQRKKTVYIAEQGLTSLGLNPQEIGGPIWARLAGVYEKIGKRIGRKKKILTLQFDDSSGERSDESGESSDLEDDFTVNTEVDLELVESDAEEEKQPIQKLEYDDETSLEFAYDMDRTLPQDDELKVQEDDELNLVEDDEDELKLVEDLLESDDDELKIAEPAEYDVAAMLAKNYEGKDPTGWWHSEKLDGVRALWTGKRMLSRNNKEYILPKFFSRLLPIDIPLDGELFIGREQFQKTVGVVRRKTPNESDWKLVKYMIYDIPLPNIPFEERYQMIKGIVKKACEKVKDCPLIVVLQTKIKDKAHLSQLHQQIIKDGGEGSIIRKAGSFYEGKRSGNLLKLKPDEETDAKVVGYEKGTGKYIGMLGSLIVELVEDPNIKFNVGSGFVDQDRKDYKSKFPIGTIIRVKYNGLTDAGVPRFPIFEGVHIDR